MRIDFLGIFVFKAKNELHGGKVSRAVRVRSNKLHLRSNNNLRCDFENMHDLD